MRIQVNADFPEKLGFLFEPHRYKVAYGGRAGTKSWGFARALLLEGARRPLRILCARETQSSIAQSVHHTLKSQLPLVGLSAVYDPLESIIRTKPGFFPSGAQTEFIFAGLRQLGVDNIKSVEDVDICWIEEATNLSRYSLDTLIPTIRKAGSQIWVSFNPSLATDVVYERFVRNPPSNCKAVKIGYEDNPWLSDEIKQEIEDCRQRCERKQNFEEFDNIWGGQVIESIEGAVYANELRQARLNGRICKVPYDSTKPVHTFWDLGERDLTVIWFAQIVGFEWRILDYYQNNRQKVAHYCGVLQERTATRGYVYGTHWLPHDAEAAQLGAPNTIRQQVAAFVGHDHVRITPKLSVAQGIAMARAIFDRCYFDEVNTADGLQGMRHYRYKIDPKSGQWSKEPEHSDPADGFRYLAVALQEPKVAKVKAASEPRVLGRDARLGWLG